MRGFRIGDILQTQDEKHIGKVTKIENQKINNELRFIVTITEKNNKEYKADIDEFFII